MEKDHTTEYDPKNLPEQVTRTIYIGYGIGKYNAGRIVLSDSYPEGTSQDFATVPLMEKDVTFSLPRAKVDIKRRMIEILEERKKEILADCHQKTKECDEEIQRLLTLEYKPEGEANES